MKTKISIETSSYNERRYGKPYIAIIDFSSDAKGEVTWGNWIGTAGYAGVLEIDAQPGDIIMQGQKDNRGSNSAPKYYQVNPTGELAAIGYNKADAYKAFKDSKATTPSRDELIAEKAKLEARLAEIETLLN